jgi:pyrroline-5-carboxylate reductase
MNSLARSTAGRFAAQTSLFVNHGSKIWLSTEAGSGLYDKIAFIGTGKMAQAMLSPLIKNGYQPEEKIAVYDVSTKSVKAVKKQFPNLQTANSIEELVTDADLIVCAVKPQNINAAFWAQFPKNLRDDATFLSILAGIPIETFEPSGVKKLVRSMPNTPATIGQGITVWCCTPELTSEERDQVKQVLNTFGKSVSSITSVVSSFHPALTDNFSCYYYFCLLLYQLNRFTWTMKNSST